MARGPSVIVGRPGRGRCAFVHPSCAKAFQLARQWSLERQRFTGRRMNKSERGCVKKHALEAELSQPAVELEVAVLVVAQDRVLQVRQVHTDLVGASGEELRLEKAEVGTP